MRRGVCESGREHVCVFVLFLLGEIVCEWRVVEASQLLQTWTFPSSGTPPSPPLVTDRHHSVYVIHSSAFIITSKE